ncbi:DNA/RNA non-specific endonuclease [Flavobacteriaceae bacterium AU392]|nr:DNA/RNA non-specific endonuclease [Flavobacteriaceae bacterium]RKM86969.1 DNA/RNA non-specific endonuclease [Flavobacteriaceae bacterium AU392]
MKKRSIYYLIALLLLIGVYLYDFYLDSQPVSKEIEEETSSQKEITNNYFLPKSTTKEIVHHNGYSLSYNEAYEQAEWVAYELKKSHLSNRSFKRPYFEIDKAISTKAAHWNNYKNSGYDRGHLCPAADRKYNKIVHDKTFLTSNISPQTHEFNSGIWNRLEQKVRYWARKYDGVFVVTGGVLNESLKTIGNENVAVPDYFYKVLLDYNNKKPKMIAFLLKHQNSNKPLSSFVVSVDKIENLTGIDFFPQLDDILEESLESSSNYNNWIF